MTTSDPIADMLTRIRNAVLVHHDSVLVPASKVKMAIARILKEEGYINSFDILKDKPHRAIKLNLKYDVETKAPAVSGLERVSKPGLRVYMERREVSRACGGQGIAVVSTSKGLMTGQQAWRQGIGGEVLFCVW